MVSVLASTAVDRGFEPDRVKPKTIKLVFVASPLNTSKLDIEILFWFYIKFMLFCPFKFSRTFICIVITEQSHKFERSYVLLSPNSH